MIRDPPFRHASAPLSSTSSRDIFSSRTFARKKMGARDPAALSVRNIVCHFYAVSQSGFRATIFFSPRYARRKENVAE
jgi:hypothetical protein